MPDTATAQIIREQERLHRESRLKDFHAEFRRRWAPEGRRERDGFEADLAMLMREVAADAQAPFVAAAAQAMAMAPSRMAPTRMMAPDWPTS